MSLFQAWPRVIPWAASTALLGLIIGCAGGGSGPLHPDAQLGALAPSTGTLEGRTLISTEQGVMQGVPGGWTWELSGDPLQVAVTPWRTTMGPQGNLFDLDIANFFAADTLRITGVRVDIDRNVIIDYVIKHPFAAPDFTKPITAANRADLGFTGELIFLIDVPGAQLASRRFFGSSVVANTDAVLNPNYFIRPGNLLATSLAGFNANAFPSRLIVDEAGGGGQGNRVGIPNGGTPTGNYNPATGGWQRNNIGANRDGWTGYDFLAQGQRASNSVVFSNAAVEAGAARFDTALMIKYTDPRGVPFPQNRDVRFPQQPADIGIFAVRMPNGALDCSDISFMSLTNKALTLGATAGSNAPLTVKLRDWDARATATTQAVLSTDTDISHVNIGTSGTPVVTLSAPALSATDFTFVAGGQSGLPGSEIQYAGTITNTLGTAPDDSRQVGLVRAVDPENTAPGRATYTFGVDPVTLAGDPARAIEAVTYQAIFFDLPSNNRAPTCGTLAINGGTAIGMGGTFTINLAGIVDADADTLSMAFEYSGPANSSTSFIALTDAARTTETMFNPFTDVRLSSKLQPPAFTGSYILHVAIQDGIGNPVDCMLPFTVVPQAASDCGTTAINETGPFAAPARFTLDLSTITDTDSTDLRFTFNYTGPQNDITDSLSLRVSNLGAEVDFDPFTDSRLNFPLQSPTLAGDYNLRIEIADGGATTTCGPYPFTVTGVANIPPDCGTFASQFPRTIVPSGTFTLDLSAVGDPDSAILDFTFAYTGASNSTSGTIPFTLAQLAGETAFNPFTDSRIAPKLMSPTTESDYALIITVSDRTDATQCGPYTFTVEGVPNLPPDCGTAGINGTGTIPQDGTFSVDLSSIDDPDTANLDFTFRYTGPDTSMSSTVSLAVASLGAESMFDPFADVRLATKLMPPNAAGSYQFFVQLNDGDNDVSCGPYPFTVTGMTGPPDCGSGITLSKSAFNTGELVDFTVNMSTITDPDSAELSVTLDYTGPSTDGTSTVTVPLPLPSALNPFTDPGLIDKLIRPTLNGTYTLRVTATDFENNTTECLTTFTITPVVGVTPVTDIDILVNYTDVAGTTGKSINTTNTLTITWAESDAPQYAVYADLNPTTDRSLPAFDPVTYKPNFPELSNELMLIGVSNTNSFTGFSVPAADGIMLAYIVVRARAVIGSAASETANSEGGFVALLADAEALGSGDPFWFITANDAADPVGFFLLDPDPFFFNGAAIGFDNVNPASIAGLVSLNIPTPLEGNVDQVHLTGNFFDVGWDTVEGQGEVGFTTTTDLSELFWAPTLAPGIVYNINSINGTFLTNSPALAVNVHEGTGPGAWSFFKYNATTTIGQGAIGSCGYSFDNVTNTLCGAECPAYDEMAWVMD